MSDTEYDGMRKAVPYLKALAAGEVPAAPLDILAAADRIAELEAENARLLALLTNTRAAAKRAGENLLRQEADAALPYFTPIWEPLRDVAERAGVQSAAWLASRARDLQGRGFVESKWAGAEKAQFKLWRLKGRPVPVTPCGPAPPAHPRRPNPVA